MNLNGDGRHDRPGDSAAAPALTDAVLESVDVKVEAFVGSVDLTVAQLNALKTGGVLTLGALLNEPVELRLNGVKIAEGELVAAGDHFAVRITLVAP